MELIAENCIPHIRVPELSQAEKALPYARFYTDYPLYPPGALQQQILNAGPMRVEDAIPVEHWLDWLSPTGYSNVVYGYILSRWSRCRLSQNLLRLVQ